MYFFPKSKSRNVSFRSKCKTPTIDYTDILPTEPSKHKSYPTVTTQNVRVNVLTRDVKLDFFP